MVLVENIGGRKTISVRNVDVGDEGAVGIDAGAVAIRVLIAAGILLGRDIAESRVIGVGRQDIVLGVRDREQVATRIVGKGSQASVRFGNRAEHEVAVVSQRYAPAR